MLVWFRSTRRIAAAPLLALCLSVAAAVALASVPAFAQHAPVHSTSHPSAPRPVPHPPAIRVPASTGTRVPSGSRGGAQQGAVSQGGSQSGAPGGSQAASEGNPSVSHPATGAVGGSPSSISSSLTPGGAGSAQPFITGSASRGAGAVGGAAQPAAGAPRSELPVAHYVGGGTPFGAGAATPVPHPPANRPWQRLPEGASSADRPPPGLCRVWLKGVPAARQPAPTSCGQAAKTRTPGSTLMFGDDGEVARPPARAAESGSASPP